VPRSEAIATIFSQMIFWLERVGCRKPHEDNVQ
jgi:hypothetical protein